MPQLSVDWAHREDMHLYGGWWAPVLQMRRPGTPS